MARGLPKYQALAVEAIAAYRAWAEAQGLESRDGEQLTLWESEIEAGKRAKLPAADKRAMDEALFWEIIEDAKEEGPDGLMVIEARLVGLTAKAIKDFASLLREKVAASKPRTEEPRSPRKIRAGGKLCRRKPPAAATTTPLASAKPRSPPSQPSSARVPKPNTAIPPAKPSIPSMKL